MTSAVVKTDAASLGGAAGRPAALNLGAVPSSEVH
jgi:hypothetical protein